MSSSPSVPSSAEVENLGVLFIGFVASTVLYGLTFFQTYIYYSRYPKDHQWIKYLVAVLCALDTVATALVSEVLYYYLIILFDVDLEVLYATTTFCVQYLLSALLTFVSHLFFAHRVFQVTGRSTSLALILIFLSFMSLAFGLTSSAQMFVHRRLSAFGSPQMEIMAAISQVTGVMADMIVFANMCHSLRRERYPEMAVPSGLFPTVITVLVGRGLAFTLAQMAYLCVFVAAPSRHFWIPMQMIASKLYVNTVLGHLNSRDVKHGQGLNEEDSSTDRRVVPIDCDGDGIGGRMVSGSLRLMNVCPVMATVQSVSLNVATESSDGMELETRKTCEDYDGNEYTQVSTGSSQSQTDNEREKNPSFPSEEGSN